MMDCMKSSQWCPPPRWLRSLGILLLGVLVSQAASQNPSPWAIDEPELNGTTTLVGKAYQQTPTGPIVVDQVWTRTWGSGQWNLNGIPVAFAPSQPFGDPVTDLHTVTAVSAGTVTLRIRWVGEGPHPSIVTVSVRSTASCEFTQLGGYGSASNGISGAPVVDVVDDSMLRRTQSSRTTHQLAVTNGVADLILTKAASANTLTGLTIGRVWADAEPSLMSLKVANVLVELNGFQYHRKPLPETLQHTIVPMSNPHHDLFVPDYANSVTLQWNAAIPKIAEATVGTSSNHDYYWLSGSVRPDYFTMSEERHTWSGHASTHASIHPHYESFDWLPGPSGASSTGAPTIPTQEFLRWPHSFRRVEGTVNGKVYKSAEFIAGFTGTETIGLNYQWGNGNSSCLCGFYPPIWSEEAHREASFGLPHELYVESNPVPSPVPSSKPISFTGLGGSTPAFRVPAGQQYNYSLTGYAQPPSFDTQAAIEIAGNAADIFGVIDNDYGKVMSSIAGLAKIGLQMYHNQFEAIPNVPKLLPSNSHCWWIVSYFVSETPPANWNQVHNTFEWEAYVRPIEELSSQVYDSYGPNGFIGRSLVRHRFELPAVSGIEMRRYYYNSPLGGPGNGGGGGGGS